MACRSYQVTRFPWLAIICWLGIGLLFVFLGTLIPSREMLMRWLFIGLGCGSVAGSGFLPKTSIQVDPGRASVLRTWGPWPGLWERTLAVPTEAISAVCYYRTYKPKPKGGFRQEFHLSVVTSEGGYVALFPALHTPRDAAAIGQELADSLGVEYRQSL